MERVDKEEINQHRKELDQQYRTSRVLGEVIERRLEAYFSSDEPKSLWHATMDLLTVQYFHLIDLDTAQLREANAGKEHSGLSADELRNQPLVLKTYREKINKSAQAVLQGAFKPFAS